MADECTHDCSSCSSNCPSRDPQSLIAPVNELSSIGKVIGVVSGKGGVGKSMVTGMLASIARRTAAQTAILDADITGPSIPRMFGLGEKAMGNEQMIFPVETKTGIKVMSINLLLENEADPVVWRGPIIAGTVKQFWTDVLWGDIDYMFVDMPPGTGDVPLTVFQSIPLDGIVIVTTPQELVSMVVEKAVRMAEMMNIPVLGLVENMSFIRCPDCGKIIEPYGPSRLDEVAQRLGIRNTARIPIDPHLSAGSDQGMIEFFEGNWLDGMAKALL